MAWGRIYKRGKNYYTDIIFQGQRKREKIGTREKEAKTILQDKLARLTLEEHGIFEPQKITFKDYAPIYLESKKKDLEPRSYVRVEICIDLHLRPFFGDDFLFNIALPKIYEYRRERMKKVSNASVNRELSALNDLLNQAKREGKIRANPIGELKELKLTEPPGRVKFLLPEQVKALIENCPPPPHPLRDIIVMALTTGMRRGEILHLKLEDVFLDRRAILVRKTKNKKPKVVPIPNSLFQVLMGRPQNTTYVFGNGKALTDVKKSFHTVMRKAKIEGFRFHDLRHHYGSMMTMLGIPTRTLQELMGHSDIKMTQRYSHLSFEHLQEAGQKADKMLPGNLLNGTILAQEAIPEEDGDEIEAVTP